MAIMAKSMGEVTYKDISSLHKWDRLLSMRLCILRMFSTIR